MIYFVICNKYENVIKEISDVVIKIMSFYEETYEMLVYNSFDEELKKFILEKSKEKVVYVLDDKLQYGEQGIEIAKNVREECDENKEIIFYTDSNSSVLQTYDYKVQPIDYILTNNKNSDMRLIKALKKAIGLLLNLSNKTNETNKKIKIKENAKEYFINLSEIICISKIKATKKISIKTIEDIIETKETLKNIENKLSPNFIRVHKSWIVNVNFIRKIVKKRSEEEIIMADGSSCPISRQKIKELNE